MNTSFAESVYDAVARIPAGKVMSYQGVAKAIGRPRAARAVGTALNHNPRIGIVPCHRVVKSDGYVGEFVYGEQEKIMLLRREGVPIDQGRIIDIGLYLYNPA